MRQPDRGPLLAVAALLFALLAVSNFLKPLELGPTPGFILFGRRLAGTANAVVGPLFGLYLLVYAAGIWGLRRWALPMGVLYAGYVVVNLALFTVRDPEPMREGMLFGLVYTLVAVGVSAGTALLLARRRQELT